MEISPNTDALLISGIWLKCRDVIPTDVGVSFIDPVDQTRETFVRYEAIQGYRMRRKSAEPAVIERYWLGE